MKRNTLNWTMTAVVALGLVGAAATAQGQETEEGAEKKFLVVQSADEVPAKLQSAVSRYLKGNKLPEGYKLKIEVDRYFDQGQTNSSNEYEPYVRSLVPVDEKGLEQGYMFVFDRVKRNLEQTIPYVDGKRHGMAQRFANRKLRSKIPWVEDKMEGLKKEFYPDGEVLTEVELADGEANGSIKTYTPEGDLMREGTMKDGKRNGPMIDYWPETGNRRRKVVYDMGEIADDVVMYHPNGNVQRVIPIHDNSRHGIGRVCDQDGKEVEKTYWVDGDQVSKFEYEQHLRTQAKNNGK